MERPNKGLSIAALAAALGGFVGPLGKVEASMAALQDAVTSSRGSSPHNRQGPGRRSILTMHRKIRANAYRDTPGAERMRDVVARRAANWQK